MFHSHTNEWTVDNPEHQIMCTLLFCHQALQACPQGTLHLCNLTCMHTHSRDARVLDPGTGIVGRMLLRVTYSWCSPVDWIKWGSCSSSVGWYWLVAPSSHGPVSTENEILEVKFVHQNQHHPSEQSKLERCFLGSQYWSTRFPCADTISPFPLSWSNILGIFFLFRKCTWHMPFWHLAKQPPTGVKCKLTIEQVLPARTDNFVVALILAGTINVTGSPTPKPNVFTWREEITYVEPSWLRSSPLCSCRYIL